MSPDGQRFLAIKAGAGTGEGATSLGVVLVQNWSEELRERVPESTRQIPWLRVFVEGVKK